MRQARLLAVINPISGGARKANIPDKIKRILGSEDVSVEVAFTEYAGHATELASAAAADGFDIVLSVGGDGTCNEIAKALVHTNTVLGIIPMGSGNGLARHLGIPVGVSAALKSLQKAHMVAVDYCQANGLPFFCTCGVGFDAQVSEKFAVSKTRGGLTYFIKTIEEYLQYKNEYYTIETADGTIKEKAFIIACGNASQYGNNAFIAPYASMCDGKIDVTVMRPFSLLGILPMTVQLFTKTIRINPHIRTFTSSEFKIIREKEGVMHIDGDPVNMPAEINIKCIRQGLKVMIPDIQAANEFEATMLTLLSNVFGIKIPKSI
ncbi:MAG: YegS/Rv2252/BmrU family lipid kinase [Bacteroidales bacterium]